MKNAKILKDTAQREAQNAEDRRKQAEKLQAKATEYMKAGDMPNSLAQNKAAQEQIAKADQFNKAALASQEEAAQLESKALVDLEREKQELQQRTQTELERIESEQKKLLGE